MSKYLIDSDIKTIREFYGISRECLHKITGISTNALLGYEQGKLAPKKFYLLIMSCLNIELFDRLFHVSKGRLSHQEINKIEQKITEERNWRNRVASEKKYELMNINISTNE